MGQSADDYFDNIPQAHYVHQRTMEDCGCAALAILLHLTYEQVADAWKNSLGKPPCLSRYCDLVSVAHYLGIRFKRGRTNNGIRRVRPEPGAKHSHWVVVLGNWVYCPTSGIYHMDHYPWQAWGDGLEIIE